MVSAYRDPANSERIFWSIGSAARSEQLFQELTETKELLSKKVSLLRSLSETDPLTGLPNRSALTQHLDHEMTCRDPEKMAFTLAFIDLDGFKEVNDSHGHDMGDEVLRWSANRLVKNLKKEDVVARFGGDEFVVLLNALDDVASAKKVFNRLIKKLSEPFEVDSVAIQISASIGITFYPQAENVDTGQLLRQADQAMYQAKIAGRNRLSVFDTATEQHQKYKLKSRNVVQAAMLDNQFELYYQPKVNMRTGAILGAEALLRWHHPDEGVKNPATFLPAISGTATGLSLGRWVLITAMAQLQQWLNQGLNMSVSINIDGYHLQHPEFLNDLTTALSGFPGLPHQRLELEVIETSAIEDINRAATVITSCRKIGIRVSLDDFGTGYSTLGHLRDLSVDVLKIDRSFVQNMLDSSGDLAIIKGVIGFASAFECNLIAEGIETLQHAQSLVELGCEGGQGFYIARPMPANMLEGWIEDWQRQGFHQHFPSLKPLGPTQK
ncbi:MAG: putative bifunctional diguanylate cyclase/phosphodiesterase [Pseudomonadota bacterium]